jgi:plastocyanin domain-containing protein
MIANLLGLLLIAAIVWWFWLYPAATTTAVASEPIEIRVNNGVYVPDHIRVVLPGPFRLRFLREDPSPCADRVTFDILDVSAELPLGEALDVVINPKAPGRYRFTCPMRMYKGTLDVRAS